MTGVGGGALSQSSTPSIGEISALLNTLNTHNMASGSGTGGWDGGDFLWFSGPHQIANNSNYIDFDMGNYPSQLLTF